MQFPSPQQQQQQHQSPPTNNGWSSPPAWHGQQQHTSTDGQPTNSFTVSQPPPPPAPSRSAIMPTPEGNGGVDVGRRLSDVLRNTTPELLAEALRHVQQQRKLDPQQPTSAPPGVAAPLPPQLPPAAPMLHTRQQHLPPLPITHTDGIQQQHPPAAMIPADSRAEVLNGGYVILPIAEYKEQQERLRRHQQAAQPLSDPLMALSPQDLQLQIQQLQQAQQQQQQQHHQQQQHQQSSPMFVSPVELAGQYQLQQQPPTVQLHSAPPSRPSPPGINSGRSEPVSNASMTGTSSNGSAAPTPNASLAPIGGPPPALPPANHPPPTTTTTTTAAPTGPVSCAATNTSTAAPRRPSALLAEYQSQVAAGGNRPSHAAPAPAQQPQVVPLEVPPPAPGDTEPGPRQLIVNYLPVDTTDAELYALFSGCGAVEAARIIYDKATGLTKGFGFVYFIRSSDAAIAVERLGGTPLRGKRLKVSYAIPQRPVSSINNLSAQQTPAGINQGMTSAPSPLAGLGGHHSFMPPPQHQQHQPQQQPPSMSPGLPPPSAILPPNSSVPPPLPLVPASPSSLSAADQQARMLGQQVLPAAGTCASATSPTRAPKAVDAIPRPTVLSDDEEEAEKLLGALLPENVMGRHSIESEERGAGNASTQLPTAATSVQTNAAGLAGYSASSPSSLLGSNPPNGERPLEEEVGVPKLPPSDHTLFDFGVGFTSGGWGHP